MQNVFDLLSKSAQTCEGDGKFIFIVDAPNVLPAAVLLLEIVCARK